ncbi:MAG: hypothetical protein KF752_00750 [Pirellulaceae bacterium]|nr:hypothetical protein [Pirellulaceae bacterium]
MRTTGDMFFAGAMIPTEVVNVGAGLFADSAAAAISALDQVPSIQSVALQSGTTSSTGTDQNQQQSSQSSPTPGSADSLGKKWLFWYGIGPVWCNGWVRGMFIDKYLDGAVPIVGEDLKILFRDLILRRKVVRLRDLAIVSARNGNLSGTITAEVVFDSEADNWMRWVLGTSQLTATWSFSNTTFPGGRTGIIGKVDFTLEDDIDALGFRESWDRGHFSAGAVPFIWHSLEALIGNWIWDGLTDSDFRIRAKITVPVKKIW